MKNALVVTITLVLCATLGISASEKQPFPWEKIKSYFGLSTPPKVKRTPEAITKIYQDMAQKEQDKQKDLPCNWDEKSHDKLVELRQQWKEKIAITFWGRQLPPDRAALDRMELDEAERTTLNEIEQLALQERHYFHKINQKEWQEREETWKSNESEVNQWQAEVKKCQQKLREIQEKLQSETCCIDQSLNMGSDLRKNLNEKGFNPSNSDQVACNYERKDTIEKNQKEINKEYLNNLINAPFDFENKLLQDHTKILLESLLEKNDKNEEILKEELKTLEGLVTEKNHFAQNEAYVKYAMIDSSLQLITPKDKNGEPIVKSYPLPLRYRWHVDKKHNPRRFPFNNTIETKRVRNLVRDYYSEQQSKE